MNKQKFLQALGARIRDARIYSGQTQWDIAHACGLSQSEVSRIECGDIDVTIRKAVEIVAICGTDLRTIIGGLI